MKNKNPGYGNNLLAGLVCGYGLSAGIAINEDRTINKKDISSINIDADLAKELKSHYNTLIDIFYSEQNFENKLKLTDEYSDANFDNPDFKELLVDCLFLNNFTEKINSENSTFFETDNWKKIENKLEYRGTQLLDCLLYIDDCRKTSRIPDLEDFLENYLMLNEDGFEEEAIIYDALIKNTDLLNESPADIYLTGENLDIDEVIKPYFIPLMLFFRKPNDIESNLIILLELNKTDMFSLTTMCMLLASQNGINAFPENLKLIIT